MTITNKIKNRAIPVGFAHPGIKPNSPGRLVNSHSVTVKFFAFTTGSFTTKIAEKNMNNIYINNKNYLIAYFIQILILI
jgi:hypothetical protein